MALTALLRRLEVSATAHGFRSTFRDWAGDTTAFPREGAEACGLSFAQQQSAAAPKV
jgi:hypothetical protein